ncbi:MAG: hypothetical protein JXP72_07270, partial [Coriobacteriia bacterium]|nr:hypothetical protein [Coriobacteriia bacterium]
MVRVGAGGAVPQAGAVVDGAMRAGTAEGPRRGLSEHAASALTKPVCGTAPLTLRHAAPTPATTIPASLDTRYLVTFDTDSMPVER